MDHHYLRNIFEAPRWIVRTGSPRRYLPKDFPPTGDDPAAAGFGTIRWS